jgi:hypothetical protein
MRKHLDSGSNMKEKHIISAASPAKKGLKEIRGNSRRTRSHSGVSLPFNRHGTDDVQL